MMQPKITFAISGASGMPIALELLRQLLINECWVNLVISKAGILTMHQELGVDLAASAERLRSKLITQFGLPQPDFLKLYAANDWFAPMASGSSVSDAMVICPCSMATLARVAHGIGDDLIVRSADVILKERKNLVLVPRETPLSALHLENMLKLARLGVSILPPVPAFYTHPQSLADVINGVVSRILDQLNIPNNLAQRWG